MWHIYLLWCIYSHIFHFGGIWWCMYVYVVHVCVCGACMLTYVLCGACICMSDVLFWWMWHIYLLWYMYSHIFHFGGIWWCMYVYVVHVCVCGACMLTYVLGGACIYMWCMNHHMFLVVDVAHVFIMVN